MKATTGRLAVVMPHGVLFRGGPEQAIRKALVEANLIDTIIGLAPNLFYNTPIPAAIALCRADRATDTGILFVDASARYKKGRNQNELSQDDVRQIVEVVSSDGSAADVDSVHARRVTRDELAANEWDLTIGRYVEIEAEDAIDFAVALAEYRDAREELRVNEERLDVLLSEAGLAG